MLFTLWSIYALILGPRLPGFQNVMVWSILPLMLYLTSRIDGTELLIKFFRILTVCVNLAALLYMVSLATQILGITPYVIYGNRSAGWVFALSLAFLAPKFAVERSMRYAILPFLAVIFSLSRTAGVVALLAVAVMIVLRTTNKELKFGLRTLITPVLSISVVSLGAWFLFNSVEVVQSRFIGGDNYEFAGVQINTSGRGTIWTLIYSGIQNHFWLGAGPGASQELVTGIFAGKVEHPHNEYLRIWFDLGFFGLFMFVLGWLILLLLLGIASVRAKQLQVRAANAGGILLSVGFLMGCFTDNLTVYFFLAYPLAVALGATLNANNRLLD